MMEKALFAAGCFWGVQDYFDQQLGVLETVAGYTGGHMEDPSYEDVSSGQTGHAEALLITFDPKKVNYETLVRHFFRMHDPTQFNRQGADVGEQYRSAIFYFDNKQREIVEKIKTAVQPQFDKPIATHIQPATTFYRAEDYHQKFAEKNGRGMCPVPYKPL